MVESEISQEQLEEMARAANEYAETVKEPREQKEQEEKVEEFQKVISSERELLKLFSPDRLKIKVVYNKQLLQFQIKPLRDTQDIENIGLDFRTYMDLDDLEREIILKKNRGEKLTSKEQVVYDEKEKEFANGAMGNALDQAHHILATFLTQPAFKRTKDPAKRYQMKVEYWQGFPFDLKMFLFSEVVNRLGINPEIELKLFQAN